MSKRTISTGQAAASIQDMESLLDQPLASIPASRIDDDLVIRVAKAHAKLKAIPKYRAFLDRGDFHHAAAMVRGLARTRDDGDDLLADCQLETIASAITRAGLR